MWSVGGNQIHRPFGRFRWTCTLPKIGLQSMQLSSFLFSSTNSLCEFFNSSLTIWSCNDWPPEILSFISAFLACHALFLFPTPEFLISVAAILLPLWNSIMPFCLYAFVPLNFQFCQLLIPCDCCSLAQMHVAAFQEIHLESSLKQCPLILHLLHFLIFVVDHWWGILKWCLR